MAAKVPSATAPVPPPAPRMHPRASDRGRFFAASDDTAMMKQIQATHSPDGRIVDVNPLLNVIEGIFRHAAPSIDGALKGKQEQADLLQEKTIEEKANMAAFEGMLEVLAFIIHKISCEISCKCSGGGDAHGTTIAIFNMLSTYSWDVKVVLTLAAFAVNYGEFTLVTQLYTTNLLANSIAFLKQLPDILEHSSSLKPLFDALNTLITAMMAVTKCIVMFRELPAQYISAETPPLSVAMSYIPTAAYWTIRSIVTCVTQVASLIGIGHNYMPSTAEAWELSSLAHKVNSIHDHLKKQIALCYEHIDEKRYLKAYQMVVHLFEVYHVDNMKVLKQLIYPKDDILPLLDCSTKTKVSIDVLRKKTVLLLISDLDISNDDIALLDLVYKDGKARPEIQYEIVWLPVVDGDPRSPAWDRTHQEKFEEVQSRMSWFSVVHPSLIEPPVIKYIKEVWDFSKRLIVVVIDPQGKVVSPNALHMMRIWVNLAYPFTKEREDILWKSESWRLELVIDGLDANLLDWMTEGKYICLYGGEDMDWIKKFTVAAKAVAKAAGINLEMCYVGKSNAKERVRKNMTTITSGKISYCFSDLTIYWFFWARLESMLHSKLQHGRTVENDPIMREVMTILSYDGSEKGWAIFFRGTAPEMARGRAEPLIDTVEGYEKWKDRVPEDGFIPAMDGYLKKIQPPHHCTQLILPGMDGEIPEKVVCAECGKVMEKFLMYRCCTE